MADDTRQKRGYKGEKLAKRYLKKQGYRHLVNNYATKQGEIDLIMQDEQTIVFVEV
jgi:putative endonuclease